MMRLSWVVYCTIVFVSQCVNELKGQQCLLVHSSSIWWSDGLKVILQTISSVDIDLQDNHLPCGHTWWQRDQRRSCHLVPFPLAWSYSSWNCYDCGWWQKDSGCGYQTHCQECVRMPIVLMLGWYWYEHHSVGLAYGGRAFWVHQDHRDQQHNFNDVSSRRRR